MNLALEINVLESQLEEAELAIQRLLSPTPEERSRVFDACGKMLPHVRADYDCWRTLKAELEQRLARLR